MIDETEKLYPVARDVSDEIKNAAELQAEEIIVFSVNMLE